MSTVREVPGGSITLRDPKMVPERLRRPVMRAAMDMLANRDQLAGIADAATPEEAVAKADPSFIITASELNDVVAVALVESWSFGPVVSVDALLDLPGVTYDAIREIVGPLWTEIVPDFGPDADPQAPTGS